MSHTNTEGKKKIKVRMLVNLPSLSTGHAFMLPIHLADCVSPRNWRITFCIQARKYQSDLLKYPHGKKHKSGHSERCRESVGIVSELHVLSSPEGREVSGNVRVT